MDHSKFKELAHQRVFGELIQAEKVILEEHLRQCSDCREEMESLLMLKNILSKPHLPEVDNKLLIEARKELQLALRKEKSQQSTIAQLLSRINFHLQMNYRVALAGLSTLCIGILLGYIFFNSPATTNLPAKNFAAENSSTLADENIRISNVRFIDRDATDGLVEFVFEAIKPMRIKGRVDDDNIKNILTYSMLNEDNPGTRLNSISLINLKKSVVVDSDIKSAVLDVVRYDENAGVRREAFKLLVKFPYDEEIKQIYLYVLMNDSSASLRIESMKALVEAGKEGHKFSSEDLSVFKEKMRTDENNYIRYYAKTVLQENE